MGVPATDAAEGPAFAAGAVEFADAPGAGTGAGAEATAGDDSTGGAPVTDDASALAFAPGADACVLSGADVSEETVAGEGAPSEPDDTVVAGECELWEPRKYAPAAMATTATTPTVANKGTREPLCFSSRSILGGADSIFAPQRTFNGLSNAVLAQGRHR